MVLGRHADMLRSSNAPRPHAGLPSALAALDQPAFHRSIAELIRTSGEGGRPMATLVDERTLDERLARLEVARRPWSPRVVSRLEALTRTDDDAALFRINPFTFASERGA
jgi:hypothetical protein